VLPPLLLLTTAIALVCMGPQGQMVRWWEGWGSYGLALAFLGLAIGLGGKLALAAWKSLRRVRGYPVIDLHGTSGRLFESSTPFIAQVGFWQPELVLSRGLLDLLDDAHLQAVLVHEQAHCFYRDTFCFFWLGWLRRLTAWLPHTEGLWQELLILRELRADRYGAQQVDRLLLAEALLMVVSTPLLELEHSHAAFSAAAMRDRLSERIDAILTAAPAEAEPTAWRWLWLLIGLLPLLVIPFHT
jgi:hypothetical protein